MLPAGVDGAPTTRALAFGAMPPAAVHGAYSTLIPRYVRIAQVLRERVFTTGGRDGLRLRAEAALAQEFGVSRETLRRALSLLRQEGLVYALRGKGNFLSPGRKVDARLTQPMGDPYISGEPSVIRILSQGYVSAPAEVAEAFGIARGRRVFLYTVLRTIDAQPFRFARAYVPEDVARLLKQAEPPRLTIAEKLEREAAVRLVRAQQTAMAVVAPRDVARALGVSPGTAVMMFRRTYYQDTGRPVELSIDYQDTKRFPYEETLVRSPG
jgi:GntR family transcriptional regulator